MAMKLTSIINVWHDCLDLLPSCIENHRSFCDAVIVVWSSTSNHGKDDKGAMLDFVIHGNHPDNVFFYQFEPSKMLKPLANETRKRNYGIEMAKSKSFTHFILGDADEFYYGPAMSAEKERFDNPNLNGLVHKLKVYIKSPTLWCMDHTLCCGIHKLTKDVYAGNFQHYPFAYDDAGHAHIDPSRRLSFTNGIEMSQVYMNHFSYCRKNIDLKIDNSSANLRRSREVIKEELRLAKPGHMSSLYHKPLQSCENVFNLPSW
jgi:hypothetical protein